MGVAVKRGVVVLGVLCVQIGAAAAQSEPRSFAAPSLRTPGPDPYAVARDAQQAAAEAAAPVRDSAHEPAAARTQPPAAPQVQPAARENAQGKSRSAAKPTPQWPLTSADVEEKRRQAQQGAASPPPPVTTWPASEVTIAKARCVSLLKDIAAVYIPMEPVREGECGTPAPVQLMAIGKNPQVVISPPATVTCDLVVALAGWLQKDVQPAARKHLGSPIVKIENMSSYSCRNAYGRAKTRLSEHGRANALDIRGFLTASGQGPEVLADWGPTYRDARASELAAARAAAAKAAAAKIEAERQPVDSGARQPVETGNIPGGIGTLIEGVPRVRVLTPPQKPEEAAPATTFVPATKLGGPGQEKPPSVNGAAGGGKTAAAPATPPAHDNSRRQQFLREIHGSACRTFATVLGPEANNAHRNHFHIDMAERGSGPFCE